MAAGIQEDAVELVDVEAPDEGRVDRVELGTMGEGSHNRLDVGVEGTPADGACDNTSDAKSWVADGTVDLDGSGVDTLDGRHLMEGLVPCLGGTVVVLCLCT